MPFFTISGIINVLKCSKSLTGSSDSIESSRKHYESFGHLRCLHPSCFIDLQNMTVFSCVKRFPHDFKDADLLSLDIRYMLCKHTKLMLCKHTQRKSAMRQTYWWKITIVLVGKRFLYPNLTKAYQDALPTPVSLASNKRCVCDVMSPDLSII